MQKTHDDILNRLAAALSERGKAKSYKPDTNPLGGHDLSQLLNGVGVAKAADHMPARNMAAAAPNEQLAFDMEAARISGRTEARADRSAKRMAAARARLDRKKQLDDIANAPTVPSAERMERAWLVVGPLVPIVTRIANGKQAWASRFLGSVVEDMAQVTLESMALILAKSDHDLDLLRVAALELAEEGERKGIPGDQLTDDERKERRKIAKARKWLMGVVNNRVMGSLVDTYTNERNLRWDNIDLISTVMASVSGVGDDPMTARFKADRAPAFLGTKFQRPGGIDSGLLATAINAAIGERGLDGIVEVMLDEQFRRSDGSVKWKKCAELIFLNTPGMGEWAWDAVVAATAHHKRPGNSRGDAARTHVRSLFAWLPGFVMAVVDAFDPSVVGWSVSGCGIPALNDDGNMVLVRRTQRDSRIHAVLASDFELFYRGPDAQHRTIGVPALRFDTIEDAKRALAEHLGILVTGEDLVTSVVHA